jgi:hypothetical protein
MFWVCSFSTSAALISGSFFRVSRCLKVFSAFQGFLSQGGYLFGVCSDLVQLCFSVRPHVQSAPFNFRLFVKVRFCFVALFLKMGTIHCRGPGGALGFRPPHPF